MGKQAEDSFSLKEKLSEEMRFLIRMWEHTKKQVYYSKYQQKLKEMVELHDRKA